MPDDGLFADPRPIPQQVPAAGLLAEWQVASLRKALDDLGLITMPERQTLIEDLAGHPVASLRQLTAGEAGAILEELTARKKATTDSGSAWDNRDGETWIDRL